jgi:dimethylamine/trimethylamine dehydrogenase
MARICHVHHYFMGGALAEKLALEGREVTLVTPAATASEWTAMTDEQPFIQARLIEAGVRIVPLRLLAATHPGRIEAACVYTGQTESLSFGSLILVTGRSADETLYTELSGDPGRLEAAGIRSLTRIGDALAPSSIADSVYSGHRFAREFDETDLPAPRRERPPH